MTRKSKMGFKSNRKSFYSTRNGEFGFQVYLNGNAVYQVIAFDTKRGFVEVATEPHEFRNGEIQTHKIRGRVTATRIKQ